VFDIVYSLNQVRISSLKQLSKLVQKSGTTPLKFVVQRPCIVLNHPIMTSNISNQHTPNSNRASLNPDDSYTNNPTPTATAILDATTANVTNTIGLVSPTPIEELIQNQTQASSIAADNISLSSLNSNITGSSTNAVATTSTTTSAIVSNTRSRFRNLENKIKSSLGSLNQVERSKIINLQSNAYLIKFYVRFKFKHFPC
jgi:hypothetical protein